MNSVEQKQDIIMLKRIIFVAFAWLTCLSGQAQLAVRDIFAAAPDSIFPLMTQNNRLDCLDFKENNMQARVKNLLDQYTEMTDLTRHYLRIQMTERSTVQMRLLSTTDSIFCLIRTYLGPKPDSRITFYRSDWTEIQMDAPQPEVEDFWSPVPDSLKQTAKFCQMSLHDLPLISIDANQDEDARLTYTLQTGELAEKEKKVAEEYTHPLLYRWNGKEFIAENRKSQ